MTQLTEHNTQNNGEEQMQNRFSPQHFWQFLGSIHHQVNCLIQSENYQDYINSEYAQGLDHSLADALQALEQVSDAYVEQQMAQGVKLDF